MSLHREKTMKCNKKYKDMTGDVSKVIVELVLNGLRSSKRLNGHHIEGGWMGWRKKTIPYLWSMICK